MFPFTALLLLNPGRPTGHWVRSHGALSISEVSAPAFSWPLLPKALGVSGVSLASFRSVISWCGEILPSASTSWGLLGILFSFALCFLMDGSHSGLHLAAFRWNSGSDLACNSCNHTWHGTEPSWLSPPGTDSFFPLQKGSCRKDFSPCRELSPWRKDLTPGVRRPGPMCWINMATYPLCFLMGQMGISFHKIQSSI